MQEKLFGPESRQALEELVENRGWFIRDRHRSAADEALDAVTTLHRRVKELGQELVRKKKDYDALPGWRLKLETAERQAREASAARRGLEKRNTDLERELADAQTKLDDFQKSLDLERKHLESQMETLRADGQYWMEEFQKKSEQEMDLRECNHEIDERLQAERAEYQRLMAELEDTRHDRDRLREELERTRRARDLFHEKLSAVALNATQINVIVQRGLEMLRKDPEMAETILRPAEEAALQENQANDLVNQLYHDSEEGMA